MDKKEYLKEYYRKNKDKIIKQQREYRQLNRKKYNAYWYCKVITQPEKYLLQSCKERAKKYKKEFTITVEDIKIPKYCPYLDLELGPFKGDATFSVDRIDNSKGYIPNNIEVISTLANRMKHIATKEQLITFSQNILKRYT